MEGHELAIRIDGDALKWIFRLAGPPEDCCVGYSVYRFEFEVVNIAGIKNQAVDALLRLETAGTDTTKLGDDLSGMLVSLIYHCGKVNDDHYGISALLCICQHCNDTVEMVNRALSKVVAITTLEQHI